MSSHHAIWTRQDPDRNSGMRIPIAIVRPALRYGVGVLLATALAAKDPSDWKQGKLVNLDAGSQSRVHGAKLAAFVPYTFRHTCLTRRATILDLYTLAYQAGQSGFGTTRRYVHPNLSTAREALERARRIQSAHGFMQPDGGDQSEAA